MDVLIDVAFGADCLERGIIFGYLCHLNCGFVQIASILVVWIFLVGPSAPLLANETDLDVVELLVLPNRILALKHRGVLQLFGV